MTRVRIAGLVLLVLLGAGLFVRITNVERFMERPRISERVGSCDQDVCPGRSRVPQVSLPLQNQGFTYSRRCKRTAERGLTNGDFALLRRRVEARCP